MSVARASTAARDSIWGESSRLGAVQHEQEPRASRKLQGADQQEGRRDVSGAHQARRRISGCTSTEAALEESWAALEQRFAQRDAQ